MALIPCEECGQAVADYRATCPFCGTSTGRPDSVPASATNSVHKPLTPSASRKPLSHNAKVGIGAVAVIAILTVIISAVGHGGSSSTDTLSPEAKAYLDKAMPALAQVTSEYQAGNVAQAAADWKAIGDFPDNNSTDDYVSGDYLTYANNVRYYMAGDGSVNLKQLEDSKTKAEQTIAAFQ